MAAILIWGRGKEKEPNNSLTTENLINNKKAAFFITQPQNTPVFLNV